MPRSRRAIATLIYRLTGLVSLLALGISIAAHAPASLVPSPESGVASTAPIGILSPADTLRKTVAAGEALIMTLPPRDNASYAPLRVPALSWLVDGSFVWRTRPEDTGMHTMTFTATADPAPPDTLVVQVRVTDSTP